MSIRVNGYGSVGLDLLVHIYSVITLFLYHGLLTVECDSPEHYECDSMVHGRVLSGLQTGSQGEYILWHRQQP